MGRKHKSKKLERFEYKDDCLLYSFSFKDPRKMGKDELFFEYLKSADTSDFRNVIAARKAFGI